MSKHTSNSLPVTAGEKAFIAIGLAGFIIASITAYAAHSAGSPIYSESASILHEVVFRVACKAPMLGLIIMTNCARER